VPPELLHRRPTSVADSLQRLDTLVSPYTGIVRSVEEVLARPDDIRLPNLRCETGYTTPLVGHGTVHLGAGSATTRNGARAAAIAEAVERYSACDSDAAPVVLASAAELGPAAVAPSRFSLFSTSQYQRAEFPYVPFAEQTRVAWVEGCSLPAGEPAWLPAQLVYLGWTPRAGEARIGQPTSNGLACHATLEEAALSGLLELLERDAFMITWKVRLSWPRVTWARESPLGRFEQRYLDPSGIRVAAIDLSAFWELPCVFGIARSAAPGQAPFGVGAGAATTVVRAVQKALDEAVRVRSWARSIREGDPDGSTVPPAERISDFDGHIRYYAYEEHLAALDFLDESEQQRDAATIPEVEGTTPLQQIASICERLAERSTSAYAVDVTAPDVRDAGLRVAKVVAPELCPLDVDHAAQHLGGRRLYEEPLRLGLRAARLSEHDLNPAPHPFP
jgi:ribosomal protein S12 methylthiotransferase accessory factor